MLADTTPRASRCQHLYQACRREGDGILADRAAVHAVSASNLFGTEAGICGEDCDAHRDVFGENTLERAARTYIHARQRIAYHARLQGWIDVGCLHQSRVIAFQR